MKIYKIYAHKKGEGMSRFYPYMGETEVTEQTDYGGGGFHVSNHETRNVIAFGEWPVDSAYEIGGLINLKSHIERIMKRLREGQFDDIDQIVIEIEDEE
jgi:hypothetical protein